MGTGRAVIVVDTGPLVALLDPEQEDHEQMLDLFESTGADWVLPSAILPEVDYLLARRAGAAAEEAFFNDIARGAFAVEWESQADFLAAHAIYSQHRALRLGLVDSLVMALSERLRASAILTFDLRHFAAVAIRGNPRLLPRDL